MVRRNWTPRNSIPGPSTPWRVALRLRYSDRTQSEDMCSNVLFIRIRSRIFANPEYKDAVPHSFTVNDHEIELWRSHHYTCTYCKCQFWFCFSKRWGEGALHLKNQATRQQRILGLWRYKFAHVGYVRILTEHVQRRVNKSRATWGRSPWRLIYLKVVLNIYGPSVIILLHANFLGAKIWGFT